MQPVLTCSQVREFDRIAVEQFGMSSLVLMENAARGATDVLCHLQGAEPGSAILVCGPGNNGGDGLAMARHLHLRGWNARVILLAEPQKISPDSAANLRILRQTAVPITIGQIPDPRQFAKWIDDTDWIVDAILGTGTRLPLRPPLIEIIRQLNRSVARRMAVDIPTGLPGDASPESGIDGDSVFHAELTVTFVACKPVMQTAAGIDLCGETRIVDIGAPPEVFTYLDLIPPTQQEI